ncbi:MAG: U32 family peptidase C-terminal domain-containing protein [Deltaproteobacteria bacterium]|nr:U32 family peptidase C-terminal domain-containing protein [Deltaproteobacteria bacterium]
MEANSSNKNNSFELVMPAGDMSKLKFAYAYGADAAYAGVPIYSLRARENGFRKESLKEAILLAKRLGKKLFLTMNIFPHNSKIAGFLDLFCEMSELEPDAFIMSDAGLIKQALKLRPNAKIHVSTQANITNWAAAEFWRDCGAKRLILSRELSLKEIAEIRDRVPGIELEAFVHGAICIAYSGRCLISNYLNHRDANQGTCTNSCRWEYKLSHEKKSLCEGETTRPGSEAAYEQLCDSYYVTEPNHREKRFEMDEDEHGTYLMNSKDLCAIELLGALADAGVTSFKVEGRTKSVYYVAIISQAYRRAIDDMAAGRAFDKDNLLEVMSTANRTLMTGFYLKRPNEYGENFEDGLSLPLSHKFAGHVQSYDPASGIAWVNFKNKIAVGSQIEWITPKKRLTETVRTLVNKKNGSLTSELHGGVFGGLPCPFVADDTTLLRVPISVEACASTDSQKSH